MRPSRGCCFHSHGLGDNDSPNSNPTEFPEEPMKLDKKKLAKFAPSFLRGWVRDYRKLVERKHIANLIFARSSGKTARVSYAGREPKPNEVVGGGRVKLASLANAFPAASDSFNILYLVSSALPDHVDIWVEKACAAGIKIVLNQNGVVYPGYRPDDWNVLNQPNAWVRERADYIIYQSQFCKFAADKYLPSPRRCLGDAVLYNPVPSSLMCGALKKNRGQFPVLILGGNQYQFYRLEAALRVAGLLNDRGCLSELIVTGKLSWIPDHAEARKMADEMLENFGLGGKVRFTGPYHQSQLLAILAQADILLHTKYLDPCPTAVVEAMACGLPVVYSATGGTPELVGPAAGIGVPSEILWEKDIVPCPEQLADAVIAVWSKIDDYSMQAKRRANEVGNEEVWLAAHREIFQKLCETVS